MSPPDRTDRNMLLVGADAPAGWPYEQWSTILPGHIFAINSRFDEYWERDVLHTARRRRMPLLPIRIAGGQALIGPQYSPHDGSGEDPARVSPTIGPAIGLGACAGCAYARDATWSPPGSSGDRPHRSAREAAPHLGLRALTEVYLRVLAQAPLAVNELAAISADGTVRRHRVLRSADCLVCGHDMTAPGDKVIDAALVPPPRALTAQVTGHAVPTRGESPFGGLDPLRMRRDLADPRFGPVVQFRRKGLMSFAMTEASVRGSEYAGFGRARTFRAADPVAVLEAYERAANVPRATPIVSARTRDELGALAIDPARLGRYTARQLAAKNCQVRAYAPDVAMDWVWGHRLTADAEPLAPVLVPAEIGFYRYSYPSGAADEPRRKCFDESSSGSALGGSFEEAALHSLIELAERDAFLLAWHRATPLPRLDPGALRDPECRMLMDMIGAQGYATHLLAATSDLRIPVVWAMAVRRDLVFPAVFSSAGAGPDPVDAVRSALWELGQLVVSGRGLDEDAARAAAADPWRIRRIDDHVCVNALPERSARSTRVLGGPVVTPAEAFEGWPGRFAAAAAGDVTGALRFVTGLFCAAGLDEIVLVDQSNGEHRAAGLSAVKAVVPGIAPMCFGYAHQRMAGIPRLERVLRQAHGGALDEAAFPYDPHPFP